MSEIRTCDSCGDQHYASDPLAARMRQYVDENGDTQREHICAHCFSNRVEAGETL